MRLLFIKDCMPWWRSSPRTGSRHVPYQSMDDSGGPRAEHVQEDFEDHERWSPIYQRVWKILFLNHPGTSTPSKRIKECCWIDYSMRRSKFGSFSNLTWEPYWGIYVSMYCITRLHGLLSHLIQLMLFNKSRNFGYPLSKVVYACNVLIMGETNILCATNLPAGVDSKGLYALVCCMYHTRGSWVHLRLLLKLPIMWSLWRLAVGLNYAFRLSEACVLDMWQCIISNFRDECKI